MGEGLREVAQLAAFGGVVFLGQQADVMDTVQTLRQRVSIAPAVSSTKGVA